MPSAMNPKEPWQLVWEEEIQNDHEGFIESLLYCEECCAKEPHRLPVEAPYIRPEPLTNYQQRERQNARIIADNWKRGR